MVDRICLRMVVSTLLGVCVAVVMVAAAAPVPSAVAQTTEILSQQEIAIGDLQPLGLSPDGSLLAAANGGGSATCVYEVPAMTELHCTELEGFTSRLRMEDVAWSPDSSTLALTESSFMTLRDGDLWLMDARSGELTNFTDDDFSGSVPLGTSSEESDAAFWLDVSPAWSPDGESITFSRSSIVIGEFAGNTIVTAPIDGGEPEVLMEISDTEPGVVYMPMRWSPDGGSLYYSISHVQPDDPENGLYRYDPATGRSEKLILATRELGTPAVVEVSPTGEHLLVNFPIGLARLGFETPVYWLYSVGTGEITPVLAPNVVEGEPGFAAAATFSPDGASLLVGTRMTDPDFQLWEVDLRSGQATQLVESLSGVTVMHPWLPPSWTASGRIFMAAEIGSGTLLEVPPRSAPELGPTATEAPEATPEAIGHDADFAAGDRVVVTSSGVPIYSAPSGLAPAVLLLESDTELMVLGPAEEAEGALWLPVQEMETRTIGFVRVELVARS